MTHVWQNERIAMRFPSVQAGAASSGLSFRETLRSESPIPYYSERVYHEGFYDQESDIIKQLSGKLLATRLLVLVGEEGCGKTVAATMITEHFKKTKENMNFFWFNIQDYSHYIYCQLHTGPRNMVVIDDFLGCYPSEAFDAWKRFRQFYETKIQSRAEEIYVIVTTRISTLEALRARTGAETELLVHSPRVTTLALDYARLWARLPAENRILKPDFKTPPSIGFPVCCKLAPHFNLFHKPRYVLRGIVNVMMTDSKKIQVAYRRLVGACSRITKKHLEENFQQPTSPASEPFDANEIMAVYRDSKGLVETKGDVAWFSTEAVCEAVMIWFCKNQPDSLVPSLSLRRLSQIALATSDEAGISDEAEKPPLPDEAKSALLKRLQTELETKNFHGVFTSCLLQHKSLRSSFESDLKVTSLMKTCDRSGLHFVFYAGALTKVFDMAISPIKELEPCVALQALLACCYWGHTKDIGGLKEIFKKRQDKMWLKTATVKGIVTGALPEATPGQEPDWKMLPLYPEDTLLTLAAWRGNDAVVRDLVTRKFDVNSRGKDGRTALMHYCARGNLEMVQFLLNENADQNKADEAGMKPLLYALQREQWKVPPKLFNLTRTDLSRALLIACANGWATETIDKLIQLGAVPSHKDALNFTCLHHACLHGYEFLVEHLLTKKEVNVQEKAILDLTPLAMALTSPGRNKLVELLASKGGTKILHQITLQMACITCDADTIRLVLPSPEVLPLTGLQYALRMACFAGNHAVLRHLLQKQDISMTVDNKGSNCLHVACEGPSKECIEMVLQISPEKLIDSKDKHEATPILRAARSGRLENVQYLEKKGARLTDQSCDGGILHEAVTSNSIPTVEWCIGTLRSDVIEKNAQGFTPFLLACRLGHRQVVKYLLEKGANINIRIKGNTCLHLAALQDDPRLINILLNKGCKKFLTARNSEGKTPQQIATEAGHSEVARCLQE